MPRTPDDPAAPHAAPAAGDAHGQAALLLVESLIHGLRERSALTTTEAIEIVERARDVQEELAHAADGSAALMWRSHALLSWIARSLKADDWRGPQAAFPPPEA